MFSVTYFSFITFFLHISTTLGPLISPAFLLFWSFTFPHFFLPFALCLALSTVINASSYIRLLSYSLSFIFSDLICHSNPLLLGSVRIAIGSTYYSHQFAEFICYHWYLAFATNVKRDKHSNSLHAHLVLFISETIQLENSKQSTPKQLLTFYTFLEDAKPSKILWISHIICVRESLYP